MSSAPSRSATSRARSATAAARRPCEERQSRLRLGVVEADENVAGGHARAFDNDDVADDAALEMLDRLALAFDGDDAGGDRSPVETRGRRPQQGAAEADAR